MHTDRLWHAKVVLCSSLHVCCLQTCGAGCKVNSRKYRRETNAIAEVRRLHKELTALRQRRRAAKSEAEYLELKEQIDRVYDQLLDEALKSGQPRDFIHRLRNKQD